jgi:cytochrome c553
MSPLSEPEGIDRVSRVVIAVGIAIAIVTTAAALFGFIILPLAEPNVATTDRLIAICRAVGLPYAAPAARRQLGLQAPPTVSHVAWTTSALATIANGDPKNGLIVAQQCILCHGEHGIVDEAQAPDVAPAIIPDIAQLNRAAIFKQLSDYRTGSRKSDIMAPIAESLNDRDMVDVIAYFAAPASSQGSLSGWSPSKGSIADLVERGVSNRGLPACASCHAMGAGGPIGAPALEGQRAAYLEQQLKFFRTGERSNDIFGAMREIANKLTDTEIASVAKYYAAMH